MAVEPKLGLGLFNPPPPAISILHPPSPIPAFQHPPTIPVHCICLLLGLPAVLLPNICILLSCNDTSAGAKEDNFPRCTALQA